MTVGLLPSASAASSPNTLTIGIDNVSPPGHNWEYVDFFPRAQVTVAQGDVLHFAWSPGAPDSFHTATFVPSGKTADQLWQQTPLFVPDSDDAGNKLLLNNVAGGPTNPPAGSGAPGACGDAGTPCTFDGSKVVSSGGNGAGSDFSVKVTAPAGNYTVVCLIHPGMKFDFTVGSAPSVQSSLDAAAASQYQADTVEGGAAEGAVHSSSTTNPDGTHNVTAYAGTSSQHVLIDEMLPANLTVHPGDKVSWIASASNIHTVSFPADNFAYEPFQAGECETASGPEPPADGPPGVACGGDPNALEQTVDATTHGSTAIRNGGYRLSATDGGVFTFGNAGFFGAAASAHPTSPIVGMIGTDNAQGYWQYGADGGVFAFGNARFLGSAASSTLSAPIVSMVADTTNSTGYVLVGADAKLYKFGALPPDIFAGGPSRLAAPIVGSAIWNNEQGTPGLWLVGADGGVFSLGGAPFYGSLGGTRLNAPIVAITSTPDGGGYWLTAADGGVFAFGNAPYLGSMGGTKLNQPIVGMAATTGAHGYELLASDGGVFTFGDARFAGSAGAIHLAAPVNGGVDVPPTVATSGIISQPPVPFPTSYTITAAEKGTFTYMCLIHDHMRGTITAG